MCKKSYNYLLKFSRYLKKCRVAPVFWTTLYFPITSRPVDHTVPSTHGGRWRILLMRTIVDRNIAAPPSSAESSARRVSSLPAYQPERFSADKRILDLIIGGQKAPEVAASWRKRMEGRFYITLLSCRLVRQWQQKHAYTLWHYRYSQHTETIEHHRK